MDIENMNIENMDNENGNNIIKEIMSQLRDDEKIELFQNIANSSDDEKIMLFITNFLNDYFITVSGIAEMARKSSQATSSMIKSNIDDFPNAYNINGTNMYKKKDVEIWLINNNKIPRNDDDIVQPEFLYGNKKSVYLTGGAGNGKSTICASAAEESIVPYLKKILTAGGCADTENLIKLHFKKNSVNYVIFHYGESCNDSIPIKLNNDNVDRIKEELENCKKKAKECRDSGNIEELIGTYVEFVLEPNKIVSKFMSECNIDILTFIDTPGLDSNHSGDSVAMADIIVIVLGDRDDVKSITEKIKNIAPETGSAQYIYLYNNRFAFDYEKSEDVYNISLEEAKVDLRGYVKDLEYLQDELVIGSTLSVCKPIDSLICVPNFSRTAGIIEEFFFTKFCEKMKESLSNSSYVIELNNMDMRSLSNKFLELLNEHIKEFVDKLPKNTSYNINSFIDEEHGRTKGLDNYRIERTYGKTMSDLKKYFYKTFSKYKTADYKDKKDESSVIRMVYLTINEGLMNKVCYGYGSHPWEDTNSPTQMICEEVLSEKLITNAGNSTYCDILKANNIKSNSWNYVYVSNTDWNKAKLEIANLYKLPSFKTDSLESYMKVCHFLPSVLVQSVLAYYKMDPSLWNKANNSSYGEVISSVMKGVQL